NGRCWKNGSRRLPDLLRLPHPQQATIEAQGCDQSSPFSLNAALGASWTRILAGFIVLRHLVYDFLESLDLATLPMPYFAMFVVSELTSGACSRPAATARAGFASPLDCWRWPYDGMIYSRDSSKGKIRSDSFSAPWDDSLPERFFRPAQFKHSS